MSKFSNISKLASKISSFDIRHEGTDARSTTKRLARKTHPLLLLIVFGLDSGNDFPVVPSRFHSLLLKRRIVIPWKKLAGVTQLAIRPSSLIMHYSSSSVVSHRRTRCNVRHQREQKREENTETGRKFCRMLQL